MYNHLIIIAALEVGRKRGRLKESTNKRKQSPQWQGGEEKSFERYVCLSIKIFLHCQDRTKEDLLLSLST